MNRTARRVLREALQLPAKARADIAGMLLRSLDAEGERPADDAWAKEVAHRVADTDAGRVKLMSWPRARRRLHRGPSKRSLREIPEVDFGTSRVKRNRYARPIATAGLVIQSGRRRPTRRLKPKQRP